MSAADGFAVYKVSVPVDDQWHEIPALPILHVACQYGVETVEVWYVSQPNGGRTQQVRVFGTGHPIPDGSAHLGTAITAGGHLVWHLFASGAVS